MFNSANTPAHDLVPGFHHLLIFIIQHPKNPVFRVNHNVVQCFEDFLIYSGNILSSVNFECHFLLFYSGNILSSVNFECHFLLFSVSAVIL